VNLVKVSPKKFCNNHRVNSEPAFPLRTERLELRPLSDEDFAVHERLFGDPAVVRYLYDNVLEGDALREHFDKRWWRGVPPEGEWANLGVVVGGLCVGEVGFGLTSAVHGTCELGYVFSPEVAGLGFATEAIRATIELCLALWRPHRLVLRMDARNDRSAALARRLGFTLEAHFRENEFVKGEWTDEFCFALLAWEWPTAAAPVGLGRLEGREGAR